MKTGASVAKVILLMIFGTLALRFCSSAHAHLDGDPEADGHYYQTGNANCGANSPGGIKFMTPEDAAQCQVDNTSFTHHSGCTFTGAKVWTCVLQPFSNNFDIPERHCDVGDGVIENGGTCVDLDPNACTYGYGEVSYVSAISISGSYVNASDPLQGFSCLWGKFGQSASVDFPGCFNVTFGPLHWRGSDEDDFTVASNDGNAVPFSPPVCDGAPPAPWPWTNVGAFNPGDINPADRCPVDSRTAIQWADDDPSPAGPSTFCHVSGCRVVPAGGVSVCDGTTCWGEYKATGDLCDGSEEASGLQSGSPDAGDAAIISELQKIYDRLGTMANLETAGFAAVVAGLAVLNNSVRDIESGGGAAGDNSDLIEDADEFDAAEGIQSVTDGMAAEQQSIEDDIAEGDLFEQAETSIKDDILSPLDVSPCVDFSFTVPGTVHDFSITCTATERVRLLLGWILNLGLAYSLFHMVTTRPQGGK